MGCAFKDSSSFFSGTIMSAGWTRVVFRNRFLIFRENVDSETFFGMQVGVGPGTLIDAYQHEHRIKGH